jgi:hypothetical protein
MLGLGSFVERIPAEIPVNSASGTITAVLSSVSGSRPSSCMVASSLILQAIDHHRCSRVASAATSDAAVTAVTFHADVIADVPGSPLVPGKAR